MDPEVDVHVTLNLSEDDHDGGDDRHVVQQAHAGVVLHFDLQCVSTKQAKRQSPTCFCVYRLVLPRETKKGGRKIC